MNITLLDLNHTTMGVHNNTVPLGLGLISKFLKKSVSHKFDIKILKDSKKLLDVLENLKPDVLGITQYVWNSELNLYFSQVIKEMNPGCLVVVGGPNLPLSASEKAKFLKEYSFIDIAVSYDGEIPFSQIVKQMLSGWTVDQVRETPVPGTYSLHPQTNAFVESKEPPPRLETLDVFGSIYADGEFGELLEEGFHPFLQTHRGCPFKCEFCHTSNIYSSKVIFQSPDIFRKDLEFLGKRYSGQHNVVLYLANTNMSLFKQDFHIAEILREIQHKYDWPVMINVNSGKDTGKLIEMLKIIDFSPAIALQTLTPVVLKNINRKNIPIDEFIYFQRQVAKITGKLSATELILSLPGETKETFSATLRTVINSGIENIVVFTLMNLKGTPLYADNIKHIGTREIKYRIVPRQFSELQGRKIIETEEVVVGTESMPYKDYYELRGLCFVIKIFFSSAELVPLKVFLRKTGKDISEWVFSIHKNLQLYPALFKNYQDFLNETESELFNDRASLVEFYDRPENWEALITGNLGDNLIRKYMRVVLFDNYDSYLALAVSSAHELVKSLCRDDFHEIIDDIAVYLSTRDSRQIIEEERYYKDQFLLLNYNLPKWFQEDSHIEKLEKYKSPTKFSAKLTKSSTGFLDSFSGINRDKIFSLQYLFHEGGIEEIWPTWSKV